MLLQSNIYGLPYIYGFFIIPFFLCRQSVWIIPCLKNTSHFKTCLLYLKIFLFFFTKSFSQYIWWIQNTDFHGCKTNLNCFSSFSWPHSLEYSSFSWPLALELLLIPVDSENPLWICQRTTGWQISGGSQRSAARTNKAEHGNFNQSSKNQLLLEILNPLLWLQTWSACGSWWICWVLELVRA